MKKTGLLSVLGFLFSFCSLCYEFSLANQLSTFTAESYYTYPMTLAVYLIFMGLGGFIWFRKERKIFNFNYKEIFIINEFIIIIVFCSFNYHLSRISTYGDTSTISVIIESLFVIACIGFFTGQELPLIFHLCEDEKLTEAQQRSVIFIDYAASLFASTLFSLFLYPKLGIIQTSIVIVLVNFLTLVILTIYFGKIKNSKILFSLLILGIPLLLASIFSNDIKIKMLTDKYKFFPNDKIVFADHTDYSRVLIFISPLKNNELVPDNHKKILAHPQKYGIYLLLNNGDQFYGPLNEEVDTYHKNLIDPIMNYMGERAKKVLILGGGDGLPAKRLLTYKGVDITLVDIDEKWIKISQTNPYLKFYNNNSLNNPRIDIHIDDAFKFVKRTKEKFDLVIIDFPEDDGLIDLRIVSLQFLRDLERILTSKGVIANIYHGWRSPHQDFPSFLSDINDIKGYTDFNNGVTPEVILTSYMSHLFPLVGVSWPFGDSSENEYATHYLQFKDKNDRERYIQYYNTNYISNLENQIERFGTFSYANSNSLYKQIKKNRSYKHISFYDPSVLHKSFWSIFE